MELIINIDENSRKQLFDIANNGLDIPLGLESRMIMAIVNGTPLPEHHGDLKDASKIIELLVSRKYDKKADSDDIVNGYNLGIDAAIRLIRHVDATTPATELPHWIERRSRMGIHDWMCSVCKCQSEDTVRICPNCGVDTGGRYEMEEDDGGYWLKRTATKEGDGE